MTPNEEWGICDAGDRWERGRNTVQSPFAPQLRQGGHGTGRDRVSKILVPQAVRDEDDDRCLCAHALRTLRRRDG
jgi:hypothetical protein